MKISKNTVFYSTLLMSLSAFFLQTLGFIYRIMISRLTGAQGMAIYQLIWPVYGVIGSISMTGVCSALTKLTAEKHAKSICCIPPLHNSAKKIFLTLFTTASLPVIIFSRWIALNILGDARCGILLLILMPTMLFTGFENLYKATFYGIRKVLPTGISEVSELFVRLVSGTVLVLVCPSDDPAVKAVMIVTGMLISEIFSSFLMSVFYKNHYIKNKNCHIAKKEKHLLKQLLSFAVPVSGAGLLGNLIGSATTIMIPRLLIIWGLPKEEAMSSFGVLKGMVSPLLMFPMIFIGSLSGVIFPKLSESRALGLQNDIKRKISLSIYVTGLFSLPITAIIIPIGPSLCSILFGQKPDSRFFFLLALVTLCSYYQVIMGSILNGIGKEKIGALFAIFGGAMQLIITCIAMPRLGINGYIVGCFGGSAFSLSAFTICVLRYSKIKIRWTIWFVYPGITASLCGVLGKMFFDWMLRSNFSVLPAVIYVIIGGALLYTLLMDLQGVHPFKYVKRLMKN